MYAASFEGVWNTNNGGATWKRVLQNDVLNLGIDPRRPETVYASATGFQSNATRNTIYKTIDGGGSWRATGPSGLHDGYFGHPIVVDRRAPGTIYAGGSRGLFASASQGRTWKKVLSLRRANSGVNGIALDPSRANVLYVGTSTHGVMKSVNGGQTWSALRLRTRHQRHRDRSHATTDDLCGRLLAHETGGSDGGHVREHGWRRHLAPPVLRADVLQGFTARADTSRTDILSSASSYVIVDDGTG